MDDISDPREISHDVGEDYGAITDEEIDENERLYRNGEISKEEFDEFVAFEKKRKLILDRIKQKKEQQQESIKPTATLERPIQKEASPSPKPIQYESKEPINKGTTSYFLNALESSQVNQAKEKKKITTLLNSRVYTFGENIEVSVEDCDELETLSGQEISRRYVKNDQLMEFLKDVKVMRIGKAMAKISPPNFDEPKYPNWCCVGIISSKSSPMRTSTNNGMFSVITITDFKYTLDVYLFGKAIEKYNKLRIGDIIAILNPEIFVKRTHDTEKFSFSIKNNMDCILEIAKSKNFGHCIALKKDGAKCGVFINKAMENYCEYHKELRLRKTASSRMEFQQNYRLNPHVKNGVQQSMYLGKNANSKYKMTIVDERGAPKTDRISNARRNFSNNEAHRAFFKESNVMNEMFEDTKSSKLKAKKAKDKAMILKELEIQKKLRSSFKEGRNLTKISGSDELASIQDQKNLLSAAFNRETLSNLGFDPTSASSSKGIMSINLNEKKSDILHELRDITKDKKIDLSISREEALKRKKMRHDTDIMIKRLKSRKVEKYLPTVVKGRTKNNEVTLSDSSSDDEFEIEETSFSTFKDGKKP